MEKKIVETVSSMGLRKWKQGMEGKETLDMYKKKERPRKELFYDRGLGSELLFKARTKSWNLNNRTHRFSDSHSRLCVSCEEGVNETVEHVILRCGAYSEIRDDFVRSAREFLGSDKWEEVTDSMDDGLSYVLGLEEGVPRGLVELTKTFLERISGRREWNTRAHDSG